LPHTHESWADITHIINCSEVANAHPQQFEYLQIASLKDVKLMVRLSSSHKQNSSVMRLSFSLLCVTLQEVIQFIHAAMEEQGKVLVSYHGRNSELAVGIVLAYLIEQHNLTYFEVRYMRRTTAVNATCSRFVL
jgi:hypothetical protein